MKPQIVERRWLTATEGRACGTCAECCTWLGIEELHKWTGQACKHLDGRNPSARCSIYESRPQACSAYFCMWRAGFGPEELKPDASGLLMTPYRREDRGPEVSNIDASAVTILITDETKGEAIWEKTVMELLMLGVTEIRLVNVKRRKALLYKDGNIYPCQVLKSKTYEELTFRTDGTVLGTYQVRSADAPDDASAAVL